MVDFLSNKWKILSVSLMVVLATGFVAPQAYAVVNPDVAAEVLQILGLLNNNSYGLKAIHNQIKPLANQTSIVNVQTTVNAIKAKTDSIPGIGSNITKIGNDVTPKEVTGLSCKLGPSLSIIVFASPITTFDTVFVRDTTNAASWQIAHPGFGDVDNLAAPVTQSNVFHHVQVAGPQGMPLTIPNGFYLQASGAAAVNDTADVTMIYAGPVTPGISCS